MKNVGFFGLSFWKAIVMLEISTFEFIKMQTFVQEEKSLNLRPKMSLFSIFRLKFGKNVIIFEISNLEFA